MKRPIWFKVKHYGWGWYPSTWQGWLVILAYVVLIVFVFKKIDSGVHSVSDSLYGISIPIAASTIVLIMVCYLFGEKPGWHWSSKTESIKDKDKNDML